MRTHIERLCPTCQKPFNTYRRNTFCSRKCSSRARPIRLVEERFWEKVDKTTTPDGCWIWTRQTTGTEGRMYGAFQWNGKQLAHRIAWTLTYGKIPDGLFVCHKCDNGLCCRPDHLWLGTHKENMKDMVQKGRQHMGPLPYEVQIRGESHGCAKLTDQIVKSMLDAYRNGEATLMQLARRYGVSHGAVSHVCKRRSWKHIP